MMEPVVFRAAVVGAIFFSVGIVSAVASRRNRHQSKSQAVSMAWPQPVEKQGHVTQPPSIADMAAKGNSNSAAKEEGFAALGSGTR